MKNSLSYNNQNKRTTKSFVTTKSENIHLDIRQQIIDSIISYFCAGYISICHSEYVLLYNSI